MPCDMNRYRSRYLILSLLVALPMLSSCSDTGRYQLVAGPDNLTTFRIDTATGDTWRTTTGVEWVLIRVAPPRNR